MFGLSSRVTTFLIQVAVIVGFAIIGGVSYTLFRTFYSVPPIILLSTKWSINTFKDLKSITEIREFKGLYDVTVDFQRTLYSQAEPTKKKSFEGGSVSVVEGNFSVLRTITVPASFGGVWCQKVTITWWPSFSQIEHSAEFPEECYDLD